MAVNKFPGKDQAWLEARLGEVQDAIMSTTVSASNGGGLQVTQRKMQDLEQVRADLIGRLSQLDPETYGDSIPARRTMPQYRL